MEEENVGKLDVDEVNKVRLIKAPVLPRFPRSCLFCATFSSSFRTTAFNSYFLPGTATKVWGCRFRQAHAGAASGVCRSLCITHPGTATIMAPN